MDETADWWITVGFRCNRCNGEGKIHTNPPGIKFSPGLHEGPCPTCHGDGQVERAVRAGELKQLLGLDMRM
jgi:DnaJ-class molecular chaperone